MRKFLAIVCLCACAMPALAQDQDARIARLEMSFNSLVTTQKAWNENLSDRMSGLEKKVDAGFKSLAPNATFVPATDGNGWNGTPAAFVSTSIPAPPSIAAQLRASAIAHRKLATLTKDPNDAALADAAEANYNAYISGAQPTVMMTTYGAPSYSAMGYSTMMSTAAGGGCANGSCSTGAAARGGLFGGRFRK